MVLYSAVSSPLDRSKRFTLSSPDRPVHSDTVLGFSWKHLVYTFTHFPHSSDMCRQCNETQCWFTETCAEYCITQIFRVEEIFAIFANLDFARNFPPEKIISTVNGISRNFPPRKNKIISLYTKTAHLSI